MPSRDAELRRRPVGVGRRESGSERAFVANNDQGVVSAVIFELGSTMEMFFRELRLKEMKAWGEFFARFKTPRAWNTTVLDERPRAVMIGERTLARQERLGAGVIGACCILGLTGAWYTLLLYGGAGVFLCLLHAVFRPRTISSKASRVSAEASAGFTIENAQNFVENMFGITGSRSQ